MSPLRQALFDYLAVRRSLGFKLGRAAGLLAQFITYAEEREEQHPRISTMLAWANALSGADVSDLDRIAGGHRDARRRGHCARP